MPVKTFAHIQVKSAYTNEKNFIKKSIHQIDIGKYHLN